MRIPQSWIMSCMVEQCYSDLNQLSSGSARCDDYISLINNDICFGNTGARGRLSLYSICGKSIQWRVLCTAAGTNARLGVTTTSNLIFEGSFGTVRRHLVSCIYYCRGIHRYVAVSDWRQILTVTEGKNSHNKRYLVAHLMFDSCFCQSTSPPTVTCHNARTTYSTIVVVVVVVVTIIITRAKVIWQ